MGVSRAAAKLVSIRFGDVYHAFTMVNEAGGTAWAEADRHKQAIMHSRLLSSAAGVARAIPMEMHPAREVASDLRRISRRLGEASQGDSISVYEGLHDQVSELIDRLYGELRTDPLLTGYLRQFVPGFTADEPLIEHTEIAL